MIPYVTYGDICVKNMYANKHKDKNVNKHRDKKNICYFLRLITFLQLKNPFGSARPTQLIPET